MLEGRFNLGATFRLGSLPDTAQVSSLARVIRLPENLRARVNGPLPPATSIQTERVNDEVPSQDHSDSPTTIIRL